MFDRLAQDDALCRASGCGKPALYLATVTSNHMNPLPPIDLVASFPLCKEHFQEGATPWLIMGSLFWSKP